MTTLPQTTSVRLQRPGAAALAIPGATPLAVPQTGFSMSGADAWRVIRQNIWLIALFGVLSIAAGLGAYYYLKTYYPKYTSQGTVKILPPVRFNPLDPTPGTMDNMGLQIEQRTQASNMRSDQLIAEVIQNSTALRETDWFKSMNGDIGEAKRQIAENLTVSPIADTRLIRVGYADKNPKDARTIVYELISAHIQNTLDQNRDQQKSRGIMLNSMKAQYQSRLNEISQELRDLSVRLNADGGAAPGQISAAQVELQTQIQKQIEVTALSSAAKGMLKAVQEQRQKGEVPAKVQEAVDHDPAISYYKQQLDGYDMDLQTLQLSMGPDNPRLQQLRQRKQILQQRYDDARTEKQLMYGQTLEDGLKDQVRQTGEQEAALNKNVADLQSKLGELNNRLGRYLNLKDEERGILEQVKRLDDQVATLQQINQAQDLSAVNWNTLPDIPDKMSSPILTACLGAAIFLGLCASLGIAFLREMMDTSVRSPRDIARVGQMNLLGMLPDAGDDPQAVGGRLPLVISDAPTSMTAEQFRQLRTRLQHAASLDTTRSILVTSPGPGDGKTTVAANLAAGLALNGRRILLVDANFKRPDLHNVFGIANDRGFSSVLASPDNFDQAAKQTKIPNLAVMATGPKPANPTELMESQLLIDFIDRALKDYDHVIFDGGPILLTSETNAMAPRVDGVVTVVRAKANSRGMLQRLRDSLRQIKAEHLGVVLNGVKATGGGYYGRNIKTYYEYQNGN